MRVSEPLNPYPGDTARTIKANYHKVSLDNFLRGVVRGNWSDRIWTR
jgi:hypothetical protein